MAETTYIVQGVGALCIYMVALVLFFFFFLTVWAFLFFFLTTANCSGYIFRKLSTI